MVPLSGKRSAASWSHLPRSAVITVAVFAFLNGWGDFIFALTVLNGATHSADHIGYLLLSRELHIGLGRSDGRCRVRHGAGGGNAGSGPALYSQWPHGGFGGGVAMRSAKPVGRGGCGAHSARDPNKLRG